MKKSRLTTLIALLTAALLAPATRADQPEKAEKPAKGIGAYILVLKDPVWLSPEEKAKAKEPDVKKYGGKLLKSKDNLREIHLPLKEASKLRKEPGVAYLQRLWTGEPFDEWEEEESAPQKTGLEPETDDTNLTWATGTYLYDGSGNIKQIGNDTYSYDTAGRLIKAVVKGTTETYKYDSFGNLTEKSVSGVPVISIPVDPQSNRVMGETYDAAGNVIQRGYAVTFTYDSLGMLTYAELTSGNRRRHLYTADDERIATRMDESLVRWRVRDFEGRVLREFQAESDRGELSGWLWTEDYAYGAGKLVGGDREEYVGGKRHFHLDHLGSVRMVTNDSKLAVARHDYLPFGVEQTGSMQEWTQMGYLRPAEPMKYTGHERDFHGALNVDNTDYIDYMHARYYDPKQGRFLSVDPVLDIKAATQNTQGWNRYAYVRNSPIRFTDPTGKYECEGSRRDCAAIRTAYNDLRRAASNLPRNSDERNRVSGVLSFLGRPGQANGVRITIGSGTIAGAAGGTSTTTHTAPVGPTGYTTQIGMNVSSIASVLGGRSQPAFAPEVAGALGHEGQHGIDQRRNGMPTNRAQALTGEISAFTTNAAVYRGLNFESGWQVWSRATGFDAQAVQRAAEQAVQDWCNAPGANCQ